MLYSVSGVVNGAIYESDNEAKSCVLLEMSERIRGASILEVMSDQVEG